MLRSQLQELPKSLKDNGHNIKEFHADVKTKITKLKSYGEDVNDLVHNLFKAYLTAKDSEFTRAIKDERRDFLLGKKVITADELMVFAETLYSLMIEENSWGSHQDQEEQIVALTSEIKNCLRVRLTTIKIRTQIPIRVKVKNQMPPREGTKILRRATLRRSPSKLFMPIGC